MSRLIVFGCSHTYGHGLPDCYRTPTESSPYTSGLQPSNLGWPNELAKLMNINTVINQSRAGASNKEIWQKIINFPFKRDDIVFTLWTYPSRFCFLDHQGEDPSKQISPGQIRHERKIDLSRIYYKHFYSEHDADVDFTLRTDHAVRYLTSKKRSLGLHLEFYNMVVELLHYHDAVKKVKWNTAKFLDIDFTELLKPYPRALDGNHFGVEANVEYARQLYKVYQEKKFIGGETI
jgi:hypothetical protein